MAEGEPFWKCRKAHQNGMGADGYLDPLVTECCAWTFSSKLYSRKILLEDVEYDYCGVKIINHNKGEFKKNSFQLGEMKETCCQGVSDTNIGDCTTSNWPKGAKEGVVAKFAADEQFWLKTFVKAWKKVTTIGFWGKQFKLTKLKNDDSE